MLVGLGWFAAVDDVLLAVPASIVMWSWDPEAGVRGTLGPGAVAELDGGFLAMACKRLGLDSAAEVRLALGPGLVGVARRVGAANAVADVGGSVGLLASVRGRLYWGKDEMPE